MQIRPSRASLKWKGGSAMVADLVRRAREGDAAAYAELVRRFQDAVFATAYQKVLDFEAARDIAQETFVRAYEALARLRDPASFPAWLLRIATNLATSWLRRPERHWLPLEPEHILVGDVAGTVASRDLVTRALSALPDHNRLALLLFLVNGYTHQEVADLTGVPVTTAKGRIARARCKLAAEVLNMVEDSLTNKAPGEQFTLDTVRKSLDETRELVEAKELGRARALAEETLTMLSEAEGDEEERRSLRLEGLSAVRSATFHVDHDRWTEVTREALRISEAMGDLEGRNNLLLQLAHHDDNLTQTERDGLLQHCVQLCKEAGQHDLAGQELFFQGWYLMIRGEFEAGKALFEEGRAVLEQTPYGIWHACLDATDEFLRLAAGQLDLDRRVFWGAVCDSFTVDRDRIVFGSQPGYGWGPPVWVGRMVLSHGFDMLWWTGWLPHSGPNVGYEEERSTFSYTGNPTRTRIWLEAGDAAVVTPAGRFGNCLLMRAATVESPCDADADPKLRENSKRWCGERHCWLARGVGPVAFRHERGDGLVAQALLADFTCPEQTDDWIPLVVGTRWEYVPPEPSKEFDALVVVRLTHLDDEGTGYLASTRWGNRKV